MKKITSRWFNRKNLIYVALVLFSLTPLIWFFGRGGFIVNGIDTNFPLDPLNWFLRRFFLWNSIPNGGLDHSSSISGMFFHLVQVIPYVLGSPLQLVQIISFVFWFSMIVFSSFWFAKIIFKDKPWIQLLFVVFYTFNIFAFNAWENSKVSTLSLLASIPIFLSIATLHAQRKLSIRSTAILSVLGGIVASGTGVNPAYLISLFLTVFIYLLGFQLVEFTKKNTAWLLKGFLVILTATLLVNSYWVIPTVSYIKGNISAEKSIDEIGFTNWVDSLSENTSLLNVMRMQGLWDWYAFDGVSGTPLYIPYALNYFKNPPFILFSFLIPSLVLLSFIFFDRKHKELYVSFGIMILIGIFLGAGTHLPTGSLYRFFLDKVPFFSLFRSPWYIFTPLVIVSYAGLLSLLFNNLKISIKLINFFVAVLVSGNLLYSYPLLTGKIFRPSKPDGFYIKFPTYVFDFKENLKLVEGEKRIIGYPDDEIEQFDWGYRGIESILTLFSDNEVLFSPLNDLNSPIVDITRQFYLYLKKGQFSGMRSLADKLNAGYIFEKADQRSLSDELPEQVKDSKVVESGEWKLYRLGEVGVEKIFSPDSYYLSYPHNKNPKALSVVGNSSVILNPDDSVLIDTYPIISDSGSIIKGENSQFKDFANMTYSQSTLASRLVKRDLSKVNYTFEVEKDGPYQPILENYALGDFGIDGSGLLFYLDGSLISLNVVRRDDTFTYFEHISLGAGNHTLIINLNNPNLVKSGNFPDTLGFKAVGVANFQVLGESDEQFLSITNVSENDAQASFPIPNFDPLNPYLVQLNYKQIYGNNAVVLITQNTDTTLVKTQTERLPNYPEWKSFSFFYEPVKTNSESSVYLVSPQTKDPLGTKIFYDNLEIYKVFMNDMFLVSEGKKQDSPKIEFVKKSPVLYTGEVQASGDHMLVFSENYSEDWEMKVFDEKGRLVSKNSPHFSTNLYANAWYLQGVSGRYKFEIYYKPQNLLNLGFIVSGLTLLGSLTFLVIRKRK